MLVHIARALAQASSELATAQAHIYRRAILDEPGQQPQQPGDHGNPILGEDPKTGGPLMSPVGQGIFLFGTLAFMIVIASIMYTIGEVVAVLTTIETPAADTPPRDQLPPYSDVPDDSSPPEPRQPIIDGDIAIDTTGTLQKPVTSSIRGTIRHVTRIGGFRARWRGFWVAVVHQAAVAAIVQAVRALFGFLPSPLALFLASTIAIILLCKVHMVWTHVVISHPVPVPWYKRIPKGTKYWKILVLPALLVAIATQALLEIPALVWKAYLSAFMGEIMAPDNAVRYALIILLGVVSYLGVFLCMFTFVYLPALVTLIRVEASLLPEDVETIVNFDRTLGGAAPELADAKGFNPRALYRAAWRSFDRGSRARLAKFFAKYYAICLGMFLSYVGFAVLVVVAFGKK